MFIVVGSENLGVLTQGAKIFDNTPAMEEGAISSLPSVSYCFKNYGKTPAIIKEISSRLVYFAKIPADPVYVARDTVLQENMIASGEFTRSSYDTNLYCSLDTAITMRQAKTIINAQSYVWFYGSVVYDDIFGQEHEHRFLWRFGGKHGFRPNYEHPNYIKNT